jgi:hypothetical protein
LAKQAHDARWEKHKLLSLDTHKYKTTFTSTTKIVLRFSIIEYLQLPSEYPPDGSYYNLDIGFYSDTVMLPV